MRFFPPGIGLLCSIELKSPLIEIKYKEEEVEEEKGPTIQVVAATIFLISFIITQCNRGGAIHLSTGNT